MECHTQSIEGKEVVCEKYEVLTGDASEYRWDAASNGQHPYCNVITDDGQIVGRSKYQDKGFLPGNIKVGKACLEYPIYQKLHCFTTYDVLIDTKCTQ